MPKLNNPKQREPFEGLCPDCDATLKCTWQETSFTYGAEQDPQTVHVELPIHSCVKCGFQTLNENAERLKHVALCQHLGVLSPGEIRDIRDVRGLSRSEFSNLTGIGKASLGRWERGESVQSIAYDRYLRLLSLPNGISNLRSLMPRNDQATSDRNSKDIEQVTRFPGLGESLRAKQEQTEFHLTSNRRVA